MAIELPPDDLEGSGEGNERGSGGGGELSHSVPGALTGIVERARDALADPKRLERLFNETDYPMLTVDGERRYLEVNRPARLLIRRTLDEMRQMRIDDLTPADGVEILESAWHELVTTGSVNGSYALGFPDGTRLDLVYSAISFPHRARHLIVFTPATWSEHELAQSRSAGANLAIELTPRELEVLSLAAMGNSAPRMAEQLVIGESTVKTHLGNIYAKLGVSDRAAAVATAIRTGLID